MMNYLQRQDDMVIIMRDLAAGMAKDNGERHERTGSFGEKSIKNENVNRHSKFCNNNSLIIENFYTDKKYIKSLFKRKKNLSVIILRIQERQDRGADTGADKYLVSMRFLKQEGRASVTVGVNR